MPAFGAASLRRLQTCDERLIRLFLEVVKEFDCTILDGARTLDQQREHVRSGRSQTMDSKHVVTAMHPKARAVDVAPYPVRWPSIESLQYEKALGRWYYFGGYVLGVARGLGIPIRWGGDWNGDHEVHDQTFDDLPHYELVE